MLELTKSMALTREERVGRTWTPIFGLILIFFMAFLLMLPFIFIGIVLRGPEFQAMIQGSLFVNLFLFVFVLFATCGYCRLVEKRSMRSMGFFKEELFKNYGLGLAIGIVFLILILVANLLVGSSTIRLNPNILWIPILVGAFGFGVQGLTEEVLCRGFLMNSFASKKGAAFGIVANSLLFSALHLLNPGITVLSVVNLFLAGIFFSLLFYLYDNIWLAGAAHSAWNFILGMVFGVKVSGMELPSSIFITEFTEGKEIFNGSLFGFEGGMIATVFLIGAILWMSLAAKKKSQERRAAESLPGISGKAAEFDTGADDRSVPQAETQTDIVAQVQIEAQTQIREQEQV